MAKKEAERRPTLLLMYLGDFAGEKNKILGGYVRLSAEQFEAGELPVEIDDISAGDGLAFYQKKSTTTGMRGSPGMVYEVEGEDVSQIYPRSARYSGQWPNREHRARWQLEHQSRRAVIDLHNRKKKDQRDDPLMECLEPVRRAYKRAVGAQRNVLLAQVVERITRR